VNRQPVDTSKFDAVAERYSEHDYADSEAYYERRAKVVASLLPPRASVLDFACGDGGLGRHLLARGFDYRGVDASEPMVEVARRALGDRVVRGTLDYTPPEHVDATTIFRSLYLAPDRRAFLEHLHGFTRAKLVFDFDPRAHDRVAVIRDVRAAGWREIEVRPFLTPQRGTLPRPIQAALHAIEPLPGARLLTTVRFPLLVSASA
jgi:SAM-dependent methyltransferase